ncbi:MAG TPA: ribonuclease G [Nevskiaceae bacterium]|nr:ribonuclease G [Nevskiaceae bacterium]
MSTEILINVGADETRVALVEDGCAREIHVQRAARHGLVGNIYRGVVKRVLPGMQAAFVDIGLERTAFLHVADMIASPAHDTALPPIGSLLCEGGEVLAQVLKDPLGTKGARLTTLLSLPSRYLVLVPGERHVGVSTKIEDEDERTRLRDVLEQVLAEVAPGIPAGIIARTAAEGVQAGPLATDLQFLLRLWGAVQTEAQGCHSVRLVHGDLPVSMRFLRDVLGTEIERVRIDSDTECQRVRQFAGVFVPELVERIETYVGPAPIFDLYGVEDALNRALDRRVALKCGGYLVIDQTEAMTTIDVNTGAFTGHYNLDDTIYKANLEAAAAIAHQLRLRNLGGIVIIDFIDMKDDEHRTQVLRTLEKELARDPARTHIHPFSPLGLVEMTRKRTRESLGHILCEACPTCNGRGTIKTIETLCHEVEREVQRAARHFDTNRFLVLAAPGVITRLQEGSAALNTIADGLHRSIKLQAEPHYPQELFDVVPL